MPRPGADTMVETGEKLNYHTPAMNIRLLTHELSKL